MRYGLPLSLVLHVTVLLAVLIGWPGSTRPTAETAHEIPVEVVRFDESSNPPPGKKPDPRDERMPEDEDTAAKSQSAQGGRTEPRIKQRDRLTRPDTQPEPPQPEVKDVPQAPDRPAATPETERRELTTPESPPEPPKVAMREPPQTPAPPDSPSRRDQELAKRPDTVPAPDRPEIRDVAPVPPKPDDAARPDKETAAPKRPLVAPKVEQHEAALRAPPKVEPKHETAIAAPKIASRPTFRPEPAPKPNPQEASLRAPARPDPRSEAAEPKREELPRVKSRPTFRPEPEPKDTRESKAATPDKRPADFDTVMRSLDKQRKAPREAETERTARPQPPGVPDRTRPGPLTLNEMDAVRRQLRPCWNFDAAARDIETLVVSVEVELDRDGGVVRHRVKDTERMGHGAFRAAADAALRALYNPRCTPLRLPAERYEHWRSLIIIFDPKDA